VLRLSGARQEVSAPDLPRFKVASVTGFAMSSGARSESTGYYVLDTWDNCAVVSSYPIRQAKHSKGRGRAPTQPQREQMAYARCAELERWHAKEMAQ
jgi:hypothetical protein